LLLKSGENRRGSHLSSSSLLSNERLAAAVQLAKIDVKKLKTLIQEDEKSKISIH